MIHSLPSIHSNEKITRDKAEIGRSPSSSSRFRELVRKKPKEAIDADQRQPPSLFALIQQDLKDTESNHKHAISSTCALAPSVATTSSTLKTTSITALPNDAPWQAVLENASQGITHLLAEKMQETTLTLDGPLFAGTPLAGVKVIVREYSTAPLAFNIHFACGPAALAYLEPHLRTLTSFFQNRRYPFSVHSVDADLGDGIPPPITREKDDERHEEPRG